MKRLLTIATLAITGTALAFFISGDSTGLPLPAESVIDDPVLATIDEACFYQVPLLDATVDFPRPAVQAEERLQQLASDAQPDPRILARLAEVQVGLSKFEDAERTMQRLAETHRDEKAGLKQLADFRHSRLNIAGEVEALRRLAPKQDAKERIETYKRIVSLMDSHLLDGVDREAILRAMIEAQPDEPAHVEALITFLRGRERVRDALLEVDSALGRFPDGKLAFLRLKAGVLKDSGRTEEALAVYSEPFDPVDGLDLFNDYLSLRRDLGSYREYERSLRRKARLGQLSERERAEHFLLMRSQRRSEEAAEALDDWVDSSGKLSAAQLEKFADAYKTVGRTRDAWRMLYTLYLGSAAKDAKERALSGLFHLTWELQGSEVNLTGRSVAAYTRIERYDTNPGVAGGVLSLLYNDQDIGEKLDDLRGVSRDIENRRMLMNIFERFAAEYPNSAELAPMYARVVGMFDEYNWPKTALRYAEEYMSKYPDDERFYEVADAAVASHRRLGAEDKVRELYTALVRRADEKQERDNYFKYLSRLVSSFAEKKDHAGAIACYWTEINAHPQDERIYQQLLEFLNRYQIFAEELKVYEKAIEAFGKRDYYDKLARWYIRQRRTDDFQDLTRRIADIFDESELSDFFGEFLERGRNVDDPDSVFYRTMFEYSNRRFPRNIRFVNGLLDFYSRFGLWPRFDEMSKRYFYASKAIRNNWLRSLSSRGLLDDMEKRLASGGGPLPEQGDRPLSPAEMLFLGEAALWGSRFEQAEPHFDQLADIYPGEKEICGALASLRRSFGRADGAEDIYSRLADIYPTEKSYPTMAGEVLIERGMIAEAALCWMRIINIEPADSDLYLEVASIFWDYYQFDRAAEVLLSARERLGDPQLFGTKLAAVYESAKDFVRAIGEYVRMLALAWEQGYGQYEANVRLNYLATRKGMKQQVEGAFASAISANADKPSYVQAYADYLERAERFNDRTSLLASAVDSYEDRDFLEWCVVAFRTANAYEAEERTLRRLIALDGESAENLMALASYLERRKRLDDAERVFLRRIEMTKTTEPEELPDYLSALDDAAAFAWRHERFDKAFGWWETAARAAEKRELQSRLESLAQRFIQRERFDEATAVLEELLTARPAWPQYINMLAQIYTRRGDYRGLAELNRRAIEAVKADDELGRESKTYRIAELRLNLIGNLVELGDYTAALDQYIEIINRQYDAVGYIEEAFRFAETHGLKDRLIGYYADVSEKSFKDFRWNAVNARLAELDNDLTQAAEHWRAAVRNEPQRIEVRAAQADVLLRLQRYAEAVEVYQEIYRLDRRNSFWLRTIAQTHAQAGDLDKARSMLDQIVAEGPAGYRKYFEIAEILEGWGELDAAGTRIDEGIAELKEDIYKQAITASDLDLFVRVGIKRGLVIETFDALLALNTVYNQESSREGNTQAYQARQGLQATYNAFSGSFASALMQYGNDAQVRLIAAKMNGYLDNFPDNTGTVNFVREAAEKMGFADITSRAIALQLGHLNKYDNRYDYRRAILAALGYHGRGGDFAGAAETLQRELSRSTMFHFRPEVLVLLAELYRYSGQPDREAGALREFYLKNGGNELRLDRTHPYVERYLEVLYNRGSDSELRDVARTANAYTGQAINFFLARNRPVLAIAAIDAAALQRSPKWRDSKKLLIETYYDVGGIDMGVRGKAEDLMRALSIGELVSSEPDTERVLVGSDFYGFAQHYSEYLRGVKHDQNFGAYAVAPAEYSPRVADAQREVARFYAKQDLYDKAMEHYNLALQLAPNDFNTDAEIGELHLKRGDRAAALEAWSKMIAGDAGINAQTRYAEVLAKNGLVEEGVSTALAYLRREMAKQYHWSLNDMMTQVVYLIDKYDGDYAPVLEAFEAIVAESDQPLDVLRFALDDLDLPHEIDLALYRLVIASAEAAIMPEGTEDDRYYEYEYGYGSAREVHRHWLEQAIKFAVDNGDSEAALSWIESYESHGYTEEMWGYMQSDGRFYQLKARALFGAGRSADALTALREVWNTDPPRLQSYEIARDILVDAGQRDEAELLMISYYREAIASGSDGGGVYTGLAATLLDRAERLSGQRAEELRSEAFELLDRMVNSNANNADGMRRAAELLERRKFDARALVYRRMLRLLDRWDHQNTLALAIAEAASGGREEATKLYRELLTGDQVPISVKRKAIYRYVLLFRDDSGAAAGEMALFEPRKDSSQLDRLAYALLAQASGNEQLYVDCVQSGLNDFFEPAILERQRAEIALAAGDKETAIRFLRLSLKHEPLASTRLILLEELLDAGRNAEALQVVDEFERSGLQARDVSELGKYIDLEDEELLEMLFKLVDAAKEALLFDSADSFESARIELAGELGMEVDQRHDEIEEARERAAPPEAKFPIVEQISN